MNALTAIQLAPNAVQPNDFYDTIARERDALSFFLSARPQPEIARVIALLGRQRQPILFTGVGKSGHIAAKIAATFSSLDIPSHFLNAAEAAHGDLGAVMPGSVVVMLSNSGSSEEIMRLVPSLRARDCTSVAVTGCDASPLALCADHLILAAIEREADPIGMAPTSSTTLQLAIGDGLAVAVSQMRGFTRDDFLRHHPAGLLGRQMIRVTSVMRQGDDLPKVEPDTPLLELLAVMSAKRMGAACVVDADNRLLGLVVDGDVRRHLQRSESLAEAKSSDLMEENPRVLNECATLGDAIAQQSRTSNAWLVMPITDDDGRLKGMLHAQDVFG